MNLIYVGAPVLVPVLAGQTVSVTTAGTITAECVSGLGLTAGSVIGSVHGSQLFGAFSADGVVRLTATIRDGSYELISDTSAFIKSVAGTYGNQVLDAASKSPVINAAGMDSKQRTFVLLGDSITEGQAYRNPLPEADYGWFYDCASGSNMIVHANCSYNSAASDAVSIVWDGSQYLKASIAGDSYGPLVDITGGGYFTCYSGTNGKYVMVAIRWRTKEVAQTYSFTNGSTSTMGLQRHYTCELWGGAIAAAGFGHHKILNYGFGGDQASDVLNRVGQVVALKPDACMLMIGVNSFNNGVTTTTASILATIDALVAAGIYVFYAPTITGTYSTGNAALWTDSVNQINYTLLTKYAGQAEIVDLCLPMLNPTGSSGAGLINTNLFASDQLHPSLVATWGPVAKIGAAALAARYPGGKRIRRVTGADAWSASNTKGNLIGANAAMTGTSGTFGTSPVPTGSMPTGWSEGVASGAFTSIVYTAPGAGSPIARDSTGQLPGNWLRGVFVNSSGSGASRYIWVDFATVPTPGSYYRMGLTLRLSAATNMTGVDVFLSTSGGYGAGPSLINLGGATPLTGATLADSGPLFLVSQPFRIHPGVVSARLYIQVGCATAGGFTLDMADPFFEPA